MNHLNINVNDTDEVTGCRKSANTEVVEFCMIILPVTLNFISTLTFNRTPNFDPSDESIGKLYVRIWPSLGFEV